MIDPAYLKKIAASLPNLPSLELVAVADEIIALRSKLGTLTEAALKDAETIFEQQSRLEASTAGFAIEHEKFLKANRRATAAESRLEECLDLIADAVANHESGGRCDNSWMDLARAAVILARNETAVERRERMCGATYQEPGSRTLRTCRLLEGHDGAHQHA